MKILIIGNGFDLAHGLPTQYIDFLDFCRTATSIAKESDDVNYYGNIKELFINSYQLQSNGEPTSSCLEKCKEVDSLIAGNVWFEYFIRIWEQGKIKGENWIDFESEISYIIEILDNASQNLNEYITDQIYIEGCMEDVDDYIEKDDFFWNVIGNYVKEYDKYTYKILRKLLMNDLKNMIKGLNLYCTSFIEEQIENSLDKVSKLQLFKNIHPTLLVSFNYTHTYQKIYGNKVKCNVFYPHGECNENRYPGAHDLVLGIDEYWTDEKRNTHTNYSVFKKYVQRIQKETYRDINSLFEEINAYRLTLDTSNSEEPKVYEDLFKEVELYFFGHSLDITDKDILYKLLQIKQVTCTIFCKDEETQGDYIANMVKIIGQDELLRRMEKDKISFCIL